MSKGLLRQGEGWAGGGEKCPPHLFFFLKRQLPIFLFTWLYLPWSSSSTSFDSLERTAGDTKNRNEPESPAAKQEEPLMVFKYIHSILFGVEIRGLSKKSGASG